MILLNSSSVSQSLHLNVHQIHVQSVQVESIKVCRLHEQLLTWIRCDSELNFLMDLSKKETSDLRPAPAVKPM